MLTQSKLFHFLTYDKDTGVFRWENPLGIKMKKGNIAGSLTDKGYIRIIINGDKYMAHRLAWFYVHGEWPKDQIDHINHDRADNRIENLREATHAINQKNKSISKNNKTGITGVHWSKAMNKWSAQIMVNGKAIYLGYYEDIHDAELKRIDANKKYKYHINHGKNRPTSPQ